jgi:hypothetical protein
VSEARAGGDGGRRVLAVGIYLTDRENRVQHLAEELARSRRWSVEQRWVALGRSEPPPELAGVTVSVVRELRPKFELLNEVLEGGPLDAYEYVIVCDDDVHLCDAFVDRYLALVERHDLALAQPARAHGSYVDHPIVEQMDGLDARLTRFVEIGPVFSVRRDAVRLLVPFDLASPMGWGYDFVWPVAIEAAGLRMGIVDATPVAHDLRKPAAHYDVLAEQRAMRAFLDARSHVSRAEAFTVLEAYA